METERELIEMMRAAAPPGQSGLDQDAVAKLRSLTTSLIAAKGGAGEEYARFQAITQRSLCLPEALLNDWLHGAVIMVTGGTGCIGSMLMGQLAGLGPARLVSVSRGVTTGHPRIPGAEYLQADIRDRERLDTLIGDIRPDIVFHVAARACNTAAFCRQQNFANTGGAATECTAYNPFRPRKTARPRLS